MTLFTIERMTMVFLSLFFLLPWLPKTPKIGQHLLLLLIYREETNNKSSLCMLLFFCPPRLSQISGTRRLTEKKMCRKDANTYGLLLL